MPLMTSESIIYQGLLYGKNLEYIHSFVSTVEFEQRSTGWARETIISDSKFVFSDCGKYIVP